MVAKTLKEGFQDRTWTSFLARWLGLSLLLHGLAALFSRGYYDSDEQFQILEFLNARLGRSPYTDLAWEYREQMRSWVQPMIYELPTRLLMTLGVNDPFHWATALRLLTAGIGWLSVAAVCSLCYFWFEDRKWREWAVRLSCLFWFLPYLHARTSSESLAGSFFLLAISAYSLGQRWDWRDRLRLGSTGALLALSFFCRFQMGFAIAAFGIWCVAVDRARPGRMLALGGALVASSVFCLVLDAWGYGHWVWTPWNYLDQNLLQGAAASIGRSPWDYYLRIFWEQIPPLGAIVLGLAIAGWCVRPLNVLSFTSIAFMAGHTWIAHKEMRFAFPIATQLPVIATFGLSRIGTWRFPRPLKALIALLLAFNAGVLLVVSLKPAIAQLGWYAEIFRHKPPILELYRSSKLDPYSPFDVPLNFYRPAGLIEHPYASPQELFGLLKADQDLWLFYETNEMAAGPLASPCHLEYTAFPSLLNYLTFLAGPRLYANRWSLFRCRL